MSKQITEIYKSRNILLEQLELQGYNVKEFSGCSLQEINIMFDKDQLNMLIYMKNTSQTKKILVKYMLNNNKQLTTKLINGCAENFINDVDSNIELNEVQPYTLTKDDSIIIISSHEINDSLIRKLKELWETNGQFITIIHMDRLQYNVLNHTRVPKHTIISDQRLAEIKTQYHITDDNEFPTISRFDPVAQAIGMRPGDYCEIIRPSKTAIFTLYYRICVNL